MAPLKLAGSRERSALRLRPAATFYGIGLALATTALTAALPALWQEHLPHTYHRLVAIGWALLLGVTAIDLLRGRRGGYRNALSLTATFGAGCALAAAASLTGSIDMGIHWVWLALASLTHAALFVLLLRERRRGRRRRVHLAWEQQQ